jgi:hypothetical protein
VSQDVFEKTLILTKVRVSADSYGLGGYGLGTGLFVRQRRSGKIDKNRV